ncbi:MAG: hypothetical protein IJS50_05270, partial [Desulfovibrio sp.]|nr:hypothetical protein [Desulfovibrio sp.]
GLLLLISCVVCRGFGGSPQASEFLLLWPCLTALGKASGGYLADKFGLAQTIFLFLLLAFLALQIKGLLAAMLLLFAFNLTMPLTLRLAHLCLPKNPGLVFGLLACALLPSAFWPFGISIPTIVLVVFVFLSLAFVKNLSHAT